MPEKGNTTYVLEDIESLNIALIRNDLTGETKSVRFDSDPYEEYIILDDKGDKLRASRRTDYIATTKEESALLSGEETIMTVQQMMNLFRKNLILQSIKLKVSMES